MSRYIASFAILFLILISSALIATHAVAGANASIGENSWAEKTPMQVARSQLGAAVVDGKIYAIGGTADGKVVGINEQYNPLVAAWTFKAPMPTPSNAFTPVVYQNKIYCIGAQVNEVYDPANDSWETKNPPPLSHFQTVISERIYAIDTTYSNSTFAYDSASDSWTPKASIPIATGGTAIACNQKIYVIGTNSLKVDLKLIEIYDPATDSWSLSPTRSAVYSGEAIATTGVYAPQRIYFIESQAVYDPLTELWQTGRQLPEGAPSGLPPNYQAVTKVPTDRMEFAIAILNDKIFVIGGVSILSESYIGYDYKSLYHDTVEEYTPFGYGTVPPQIVVISPAVSNYSISDVPLIFNINKDAELIQYSLDNGDNLTIAGNSTLPNLMDGSHIVTLYSTDTFGNIGASQTVTFNVDKEAQTQLQPKFPETELAIIISIGLFIPIIAAAALLHYYKKKR
jgi:hypothetical protein